MIYAKRSKPERRVIITPKLSPIGKNLNSIVLSPAGTKTAIKPPSTSSISVYLPFTKALKPLS